MQTDNIFHLVHRFGTLEDQISACFGFILRVNPPVLRALLNRLGVPTEGLTKDSIKLIDVETQVSYTGREDEQSRIDLQLRLADRFNVFFESKLGHTALGKTQLGKYTRILKDERKTHEQIRLVLVTQFNRMDEAKRWERTLCSTGGLKAREFCYLRWEEIYQLVKETPTNATTKCLNHLFLEYVGDMMTDKKVIKDQRIGAVKDVMIIATDPDWWELVQKERIACEHNNSPDAHYVAFYRTKPEAAITHIAEVEWTEKNVLPKDTYRNYPKIWKKGKERGWIDRPHKVYHLKELVKMPVAIGRRHGRTAAIRVKTFKTLPELLKARYLDDLFRKQKGRNSNHETLKRQADQFNQ